MSEEHESVECPSCGAMCKCDVGDEVVCECGELIFHSPVKETEHE